MATVSPVRIGNLALSHIGANSQIESLTESSAAAKQVNLWYDFAREQTLAAFPWNFALKRIALTAHSEAPPTGVWTYRYQYPSDCLQAREIVNPFGWQADAIPFQVENGSDGESKSILTDMEEATLKYTWDVTDTNLFSPHFILTMSFVLASYIAFPITGKTELANNMAGRAQQALVTAPAQNANEGVQRGPREAAWIRGRGYTSENNNIFTSNT